MNYAREIYVEKEKNTKKCVHLLHNVCPDSLLGRNKQLALYNYRHSYTVDNRALFDNIDPYNLPDIDRFYRDCTNRY